jgi:iron uptake system component EfeO
VKKLALASAAALGAVGALAGCASTSSSANDGTIAVSSTNDACQLAVAEAPAGTISFKVTNNGDQVTEFYLLGDDGLRVISEAENIGPGLSRELVAQATEGKYFASCKPGMTGDGIRFRSP